MEILDPTLADLLLSMKMEIIYLTVGIVMTDLLCRAVLPTKGAYFGSHVSELEMLYM